MDCFPDFCLGCDNQVTSGLYCSEACRMSDIEKSGSVPASPVLTHHVNPYQLIFPTTFHQSASQFSQPKSSSSTSLPSRSTPHQYSKSAGSQSAQLSPRRVLSPSSSRSSLISNPSVVSPDASEQTARELSSYFNAFDRTRDQRRKSLPANKAIAALHTIHTFADNH